MTKFRFLHDPDMGCDRRNPSRYGPVGEKRQEISPPGRDAKFGRPHQVFDPCGKIVNGFKQAAFPGRFS